MYVFVGHDDLKAGTKRVAGMEGITLSLANLDCAAVNKSTVIVAATKDAAGTEYKFDGWSLATAVVTSLKRGFQGIESVNPLTDEACVLRIKVAAVRTDSVMVSSVVRWLEAQRN